VTQHYESGGDQLYGIRPSKGVSFITMIVGALFTIYGLFEVISRSGLFGVIWVIVALLITIYHGINVFSKKGIPFGIIEKKNKRKLK